MSASGSPWLPWGKSTFNSSFRVELTNGSGFLNGIIAYGVSFIHSSRLESWRILFLIEGGFTLLLAIIALIILPEHIDSARFLTKEEKEFRKLQSSLGPFSKTLLHCSVLYERSLSMAPETNTINWKHAREVPFRWQQMLRESLLE